ncbi:alcohol dehydrogenase catalytic domain-containing protein [Virgibacillus salexigens]|uniref:L-threonine 3-dehydrogenase n=1 Tax=Virgibacillus massiliensis TaxID=1462526 RepID=A0A024QCL7_9BACI|nr:MULTISPECIES: zinc-binding alcohol dehydrogenase [Virgibacillus]CDQ39967.1 L-threonine 3-dehydrogenase [Virgibacillus massiliensis]
MKQHSLELNGRRLLKWQVRELPPLDKNEVLIKTILGSISVGAEMPQYNESDITDVNPKYPKNTGYENYGEVISIGANVQSLQIGDRVIAFYGHKDFSIAKENNVIPVPKDTPCSPALLTILSCDSAKGVLKLDPNREEKVLVTGMGAMGLLAVYFLKNYVGVDQVDIIEPDVCRRDIARNFGVKSAFEIQNQLGYEYDFGIECSGKYSAFQALQKSIKKDGEICILSDGNKEEFRLQPEFYEKELRIVGSSDGWDYKKHSQWFFKHVKKTPYIDQLFQYETSKENLIQCFKDLSKGTIKPLKVLVHY